ncbi:MAG: trehalase family glycosidase [Spirochaetota bacterium]
MADLSERVKPVLEWVRGAWGSTVRRVGHDAHPRLYLPHEFTAPCANDRFRELYYWDTYFAHLGLLRHDRAHLCQANIQNMFYMVEKFGHVLNSNAVWHLNRSQPPYLAMMVRDLYERTRDRGWLASAWSPLRAEYGFWMSRRATETGLNRYLHAASEHDLIEFYRDTLVPRLGLPEADEQTMREVSYHYTAEAESGHDFTPRFRGRCADHLPVDLNSNLYEYERTFALLSRILGRGEEERWLERAEERLTRMRRYTWDGALGCFNDYDMKSDEPTGVTNAASFWPLAYGMATADEAASTVRLLRRLELPHGVSTTGDEGNARSYQWGYPNAWPPVQVMVVRGLLRYGYTAEARRIASSFLETVVRAFERDGVLWEKYDAETGEPGGAEYEPTRMLGWSAGAVVYLAEIVALPDQDS